MKLLCGIFCIIIVTIGVQGATKIDIYEVHDTDNGILLKNMNSNENNDQKNDLRSQGLRIPGPKKTYRKLVSFANNILKKLKLKSLRANENTNRFNDDTYIYIINSDDFDDNSSQEEAVFVDKTRNERVTNNIDKNEITNLLLQLLQSKQKTPHQRKRKVLQQRVNILTKPVLRAIPEDVPFLPDFHKRKHTKHVEDDDDGQTDSDRRSDDD